MSEHEVKEKAVHAPAHESREAAHGPAKGASGIAGRKRMILVGIIILIVAIIGGGAYLYVSSKTVYIDESDVEAPTINLSPSSAGNLEAVFVKVGDSVTADEPVAQVGNEIVKAKTAGIITSVDQNIGEYESPMTGQAIVATMIDPTQLRVVGHLDENKGLADVKVGDPATFTVDAFGSKQYKGVVDEVSPTSRASDVVFDISDSRPTNEFDIYVRFDPAQYPELKNGMSARIWVYKN